MKNVLVINGSPKGEGSNTMRLTRAFIDGAGWESAEIVEVAKAGIKSCLGCYCCWNKTPGECVLSDGMADILQKMIAADVIVWSFPLYYFGVPGGLKNLIDRQLPLNLPFMAKESESGGHPARHDLSHQRHIVISTCGFWTVKSNYDGVTAMFDHFCGAEKYSAILCGQGELFRVPELKGRTDAYLDVVRRAGGEYVGGRISEATKAELAEPLFPRDVFETMADASWGVAQTTDEESADESLAFTTQMAALYRPDGVERVLEIQYTDINKVYQIVMNDGGSKIITEGFGRYTTRIETPFSVWVAIARGEISGQDALFQRKYRVLGDFGLMLRWDELFGGIAAQKAETKQRKPNMLALLLPWIAIWTILPINALWGGIVGVLAVAALPLVWLLIRPTPFERASAPVVAVLSLMALLGVETRLVALLSYAVFGVIWLVGAFTKRPLTAFYSANNYGGETAHQNPLFVRTNRILTAAWGMLYLATTVWTGVLMKTSASPYVGLINSACPMLMGAFTAWFQKWYPARWAKGMAR